MILSAYHYQYSRGYRAVNFDAAGGIENYTVYIDGKKKTFPGTIQGNDAAREYYYAMVERAERQEKLLED